MRLEDTPPCSAPTTPESKTPDMGATSMLAPHSPVSASQSISSEGFTPPTSKARHSIFQIPSNITQDIVEADPKLKRLQQDLLVLTSFNDNSTLHWRPSWFPQGPFSGRFWTLHNPPDVVTECLPNHFHGRQVFTRRMRRAGERLSSYIRDDNHWKSYCKQFGVPEDFLCAEQIELMRLGLPKSIDGTLCEPPSYPLYPEPQPFGQEHYLLNASTYETHLPRKFHSVDRSFSHPDYGEYGETVVVYSTGALEVEMRDEHFLHECQYRHYDGIGGRRPDYNYTPELSAPRSQGPCRRWSYLPWTKEQEESCQPLKLKLRYWNTAMKTDSTKARMEG